MAAQVAQRSSLQLTDASIVSLFRVLLYSDHLNWINVLLF